MPVSKDEIFNIPDEAAFNKYALKLFRHQSININVYAEYLSYLKCDSESVDRIELIPFLPISVFRNYAVTDSQGAGITFTSSGTTGIIPSKHYVSDPGIYDKSLVEGFKRIYGSPDEYCFIALLPSYLERSGSSLVYMVNHLMQISGHEKNGFYLNEFELLAAVIDDLAAGSKKIFMIGVTYALIDFFEKHPMQLKNTILVETGGMKGRRKEMIREEVHTILKKNTGLNVVHSEYGMTELLSQAWSKGEGKFECPPWMRILIEDLHDPFSIAKNGETGRVKVIDLANIHSCAFIETDDLGRMHDDGKFEILGRMDHSEWRGCNLMIG